MNADYPLRRFSLQDDYYDDPFDPAEPVWGDEDDQFVYDDPYYDGLCVETPKRSQRL